jgi:hypothetical protein
VWTFCFRLPGFPTLAQKASKDDTRKEPLAKPFRKREGCGREQEQRPVLFYRAFIIRGTPATRDS